MNLTRLVWISLVLANIAGGARAVEMPDSLLLKDLPQFQVEVWFRERIPVNGAREVCFRQGYLLDGERLELTRKWGNDLCCLLLRPEIEPAKALQPSVLPRAFVSAEVTEQALETHGRKTSKLIRTELLLNSPTVASLSCTVAGSEPAFRDLRHFGKYVQVVARGERQRRIHHVTAPRS